MTTLGSLITNAVQKEQSEYVPVNQQKLMEEVTKEKNVAISPETEMVMCIPSHGSMDIGNVLTDSLLMGGNYVHNINSLSVHLDALDSFLKEANPITCSYLEAFCNGTVKNLPIVYLPRAYAETREDMKQIVVGAFIHSDSKILLMECLDGDMENNLTLVEGHVGVPNSELNEGKHYPSLSKKFFDILKEHVTREIIEELSISDATQLLAELIKHDGHTRAPVSTGLRYLSIMEDQELNPISFKHIGFIYDVYISDEIFDKCTFESNEDCNRVRIIDSHEASNKELFDRYDDWVKDIVKDWL